MRFPIEDKILDCLRLVEYATIYNFQPYLSSKALNVSNGLLWSTKIFNKLIKQKRIHPIGLYPYSGRTYRYNTFYKINLMKHDKVGYREKEPPNIIASSMAMHQSGIRDILLGFIFLYPDYEVSIKFEPEYPFSGKTYFKRLGKISNNDNNILTYRPDAFVKLISRDNKKEYDFLIELERTKRPHEIKIGKFDKIESLNSFSTYGLSENTKILIFYSYEKYNVYSRPLEYSDPKVKKEIEAVESRIEQLLNYSKSYPNHKYRMIPFHDFYRLNEAVWYTPQGRRVKLISN